jgi:hypothetical protein
VDEEKDADGEGGGGEVVANQMEQLGTSNEDKYKRDLTDQAIADGKRGAGRITIS